MRVLFDGQAFVHQATGGVSRYFANLLAGINAEPGCSARVLAPLHKNEYLAALRRQGVLGMSIRSSPLNDQLALLTTRLVSLCGGWLLPADIVHETYFSSKPYIPRAHRRCTTVYDMTHEIYRPDAFTAEQKRASVARCDHVLCISHNTRDDLCEILKLPRERTSVVHLGYQDFCARPEQEATAAIQGRPYFLYVGPRAQYKNFDALLQAFAASALLQRDFRIVCFGGGALGPAELERSAALGLSPEHVMQTGGPDRDLAVAYQNAVAFVYPSLYEGFGLPPLEAMSAGCPVISSNSSSLPEVVGDAALTFDPKDVDALRDGLERVAQSSELRADLVARGHARRALFSWRRCAQETIAVYRGLM